MHTASPVNPYRKYLGMLLLLILFSTKSAKVISLLRMKSNLVKAPILCHITLAKIIFLQNILHIISDKHSLLSYEFY